MSAPDRRPARADLGPVTRAWVKEVGWRSVNMHTHISLVHGYVYVEVPKAGCGTMKATLGGLEAARMGPWMATRVQAEPHNRLAATPFVKPFQLPPDLLEAVLASSDYARFSVVREPASRALSAYLEKIRQGLKQSDAVVDALESMTGLRKAPQDITFAEFVDVIAAQTSRDQDPHWRRQADHLGVGIVDYDALIHLDQLDTSWARIADLVGVPDLQEEFFCKNSTGAGTKMSDYYTADLLARVHDAYSRDYAELGFARPS